MRNTERILTAFTNRLLDSRQKQYAEYTVRTERLSIPQLRAVAQPFPAVSHHGDAEKETEDSYSGLANPAGVWIEPIQGEGGIVVPPSGFLSELKTITDANDIPLIVDEIQTGFGRTGQWFASDWEDVTPDMMPMAKGIGGIGLPLSGTMYHESLDTWEAGGHVGTFRGNVPAMVAGTRTIEYIEDNDLLAHARDIGEYMRDRLREIAASTDRLIDVRGRGMFTGAEFTSTETESGKELVKGIQEYCYERGVLVWSAGRQSNVLRLIPPLVLTQDQAETGMNIVVEGIDQRI